MIKYKQGDLLKAFNEGEVNVIGHQCNCTVGMGAGIAKKIAERYPIVEVLDKGFRKNGISRALMVDIEETPFYKILFNLYSQYFPGQPTSNNNVFYNNQTVNDSFIQREEWLRLSLRDMRTYLSDNDKIGLPLIASGLAANKQLKGKMTDLEYFKKYIAPIVEEELKDFDVTVYYL